MRLHNDFLLLSLLPALDRTATGAEPIERPALRGAAALRLVRNQRAGALLLLWTGLVVVLPAGEAFAQGPGASALSAPAGGPASLPIDNPMGMPDLSGVMPAAKDAQGVTASIAIFVLLTVLSLAPAILIMATSFTRMVIVLALIRQAIGTQNLPPSQVVTSLALIMSAIVMAPTWQKIQADAVDPYMAGKLDQRAALVRGVEPLRDFMTRQIEHAHNEDDVYLFVEHSRGAPWPEDKPLQWNQVRLWELVPAFVLSELKVAFIMGFRMYLPFLVIDMVISAILISMGMLMLPPVLISLPFKLLLFVVADGWNLVVGSLLESFV